MDKAVTHLFPWIQDLAIILGLAGVISLIFKKINQPIILGYLIAGVIVGPYTPPFSLIIDELGVKIWAELGIIFLMFGLGLEFNFTKLRKVGKTAGIAASFEVFLMLLIGFFAGKIAGLPLMDCIYLGSLLTISSTTIIIKSFEELKLSTQRFANIVFGILIVEDLIGILILVGLTTLSLNPDLSSIAIIWAGTKLFVVVGCWIAFGIFLVPPLVNYVGKIATDEILIILCLSLCLGLVVFSTSFNYPAALGSFIMGSIVAESREIERVKKLMKPIQDLFAAIFFVSIGMLLDPIFIIYHWQLILVVTLLTIVGKIISSTLGTLLSGEDFNTSINVGFGLAQIGEFSFIIVGLGVTLGAVGPSLYPVAVSVSILTTFTTPYLIRFARKITK
jgi:monovalent cation:H+ antiporter-2, CPA2 family